MGLGLALALTLAASLTLGAATAESPALDLFDEAAYHLTLQYGGFADPPPADLAPDLRAALADACEAGAEACTPSDGADAVRDLVDALDDGHTAYLDPDAFAALTRRLSGDGSSDRGFGWLLATDPDEGAMVVDRTFAGGPAREAGLRRGDRPVALNGDPVPSGEAGRESLRRAAAEGSPARLTFRRDGTFQPTVTLKAESAQPLPTLDLLPGDVGWIQIPTFFVIGAIGSAVHERVREASAAGARSLIVDVRGNPGGFVHESLVAAGAFLPEPSRRIEARQIDSVWRFRDGVLTIRSGDGPEFPQAEVEELARFRGPVAVLIDQRSASSAEFFALDLNDHADAVIVGETSVGVADTVTAFAGLSNGGGLQITTGRVRTVDGDPYPAHVVPDRTVDAAEAPLPAHADPVVQAALRALRTP
ncbi:MAG: S41 family peptidase [Trueperaceae bacterium]